jgi:hypothetical protein
MSNVPNRLDHSIGECKWHAVSAPKVVHYTVACAAIPLPTMADS